MLFALSGNKCAFPKCEQEIINKDGVVIGEICHIEAAEKGGERYNPDQDDEQRRSFDNLILLCSNHHKITNNVQNYPTWKLKKMKDDHEKNLTGKTINVDDNTIDEIKKKYVTQNTSSSIINNPHTQLIGTQIGSQKTIINPPPKDYFHYYFLTVITVAVLIIYLIAIPNPPIEPPVENLNMEKLENYFNAINNPNEDFEKKEDLIEEFTKLANTKSKVLILGKDKDPLEAFQLQDFLERTSFGEFIDIMPYEIEGETIIFIKN